MKQRPDLWQESTQLLLHSRWVTFDASGKSGRRGQSIRSLLLPVTGDGQEETSSPFKEELICAFTKHSMASLSQLQRNCSQGSPDSGNKTKIQTRLYWKIFFTSCFFLPCKVCVRILLGVSLFILCFSVLNSVKFCNLTLVLNTSQCSLAWLATDYCLSGWVCRVWRTAEQCSCFSMENLIQLILHSTFHRLLKNIPPNSKKSPSTSQNFVICSL